MHNAKSSTVRHEGTFASSSLLEKYGWQGGGLGKNEDGMKDALKVKLKRDNHGVGHDVGEQFTFKWWEHVFDKAAGNIKVNSDEEAVSVSAVGDNTVISNKKANNSATNRQMLYGRFIKSSTLTDGVETSEVTASADVDCSDSKREVVGTATILTDEELFKVCGGRTAHKGARHGLKLNGKLARIEQQEQISSTKTGTTVAGQPRKQTSSTKTGTTMPGQFRGLKEEMNNGELKRISKKSCVEDPADSVLVEHCSVSDAGWEQKQSKRHRRHLKTDVSGYDGVELCVAGVEENKIEGGDVMERDLTETEVETRRGSKKKRKRDKQQVVEIVRDVEVGNCIVGDVSVAGTQNDVVEKLKKKKKKVRESCTADCELVVESLCVDGGKHEEKSSKKVRNWSKKERQKFQIGDVSEDFEEHTKNVGALDHVTVCRTDRTIKKRCRSGTNVDFVENCISAADLSATVLDKRIKDERLKARKTNEHANVGDVINVKQKKCSPVSIS